MNRDGRVLGYHPLIASLLSLGGATVALAPVRATRATRADRPAFYTPNARHRRVKPLRPAIHCGMWRKLQKRSVW